jgi:subtilisin family serine protease
MTSSRRRPRLLVMAVVALTALAGVAAVAGPGAAQTAPSLPPPIQVNDPAVTDGLAWHLDDTNVRRAWRYSLGNGIVVAVVDSGVDASHPDLSGQVAETVSCVGAQGDPDQCRGPGQDLSGHGTHVAGIIAARADDLIGVAGVAPRAQILGIRALRTTCSAHRCTPKGDAADVAAGVRWAIDHQADIINLSVASDDRLGPDLADAINEAWAAGAIPVLAAGNTPSAPMFLDTKSAVIVTATDRTGELARYAPSVDVPPLGMAAPGGAEGDTTDTCHVGGRPVGILSTFARSQGDKSGYACLAGTSMAAPQVSGALALLLSMGLTREDALERLVETAHQGEGLGAGRIDVAAAAAPPWPVGVTNLHDPFTIEGKTPPLPAAATVGPFSVPKEDDGPALPLWAAMLGGGLVLGIGAEGFLRWRARRRRSADPTAGDGQGAATGDGDGGPALVGAGVPLGAPLPTSPPLAPEPVDPVGSVDREPEHP